MRYQTVVGQRTFNDSHRSQHLFGANTHGIPLYNANSTYTIRVTAVTDDGEVITSDDFTISDFVDYDLVGGASEYD